MDLDQLGRRQHGVVSRAQALLAITPAAVGWRLQRGLWATVHPGVYRIHTGSLDWLGRASAALMACGIGAALELGSAAYVHGIETRPPPMIQVAVPHSARRRRPVGVRMRRRRVLEPVQRRGLSVTSVATTVMDLADLATASREDAIAVAARAVQKRKVSVEALACELRSRRAHRQRLALELSLAIIAHGAESVLEVEFVERVLLAHGLPLMQMAVPGTVAGRSIRRDFVDAECGVVVELDGRLGHEGERGRDNVRDRRTAAEGGVTVRAEWVDVRFEPCQLAFDIFATRRSRGAPQDITPCGPGCRVPRLMTGGT